MLDDRRKSEVMSFLQKEEDQRFKIIFEAGSLSKQLAKFSEVTCYLNEWSSAIAHAQIEQTWRFGDAGKTEGTIFFSGSISLPQILHSS